jgi:hypothetical protein
MKRKMYVEIYLEAINTEKYLDSEPKHYLRRDYMDSKSLFYVFLISFSVTSCLELIKFITADDFTKHTKIITI